MRRHSLFLAIALVVIAGSGYAQTKLHEVDLRISGVHSGSSYREVVANLGKPAKRNYRKESGENSCLGSDATILVLYYPGLKVVLLGDGSGRNLKVVEMSMTWGVRPASGVMLGATSAQLRRRFGRPVSIHRKDGHTTFFYVTPGNLGGVNFEFTNGRLVSVLMRETLC